MGKRRTEIGVESLKEPVDDRPDELTDENASGLNPRIIAMLWYLAAIPSLWSFGYTMMRGSDLWWHIATGRLMIEQKSLPLVDNWSFTRMGQPWLQHEWLSDLLFQLWVASFGINSLVYWKWAVLLTTFLLLFHVVRRITGEPLSRYLSVLLAIAVAAPFLDIRPHLYSALGYVLLLSLTLKATRPPLYLPLLFLVWVNLHGGFFFGLMALFVLLLPSLISGSRATRLRSLWIMLGSVLICLVNPNGIEAFAYPLKYAFDSSSPFSRTIDEWQPPFVAGGIRSPLYPYAIVVLLAAALFLILRRSELKRAFHWPSLALAVLTLAMSLTSRRFIVLFAISQSLVTGPALAALVRQRIQRIPKLVAPALVMLLGIVWLLPFPIRPYAFHYLTAEDEFPVETCNFIEKNQLSGNVFSYYNWGGYLHLRTNGRMKVYIDGRADTVYDAETLRRYAQVQGFHPGWEQIIETSGAQYILWPRNEQGKPLAVLVTSGRWRVLYDDFVSVLLARNDGSEQKNAESLKPTDDSAYRRLTLGIQHFEQRRYSVAETHLRSALELMPHLRTACYSLSRAQATQGRQQEAQQTLKECKGFFP